MRVEHFALQVPDSVAMAEWYVKYLGCTVARALGPPNHGRFLHAGPVMIELYQGSAVASMDFVRLHPSQLHLAFVSENLPADRDRLLTGGAKLVEDLFHNADGDQLVMLRDPWGVAVQLVKRTVPMLT